jgi:hypothetical protein
MRCTPKANFIPSLSDRVTYCGLLTLSQLRYFLIVLCGLLLFEKTGHTQCNISAPVITANSVSSCSVTISWPLDNLASKYKVKYKIQSQSSWLQVVNVGLKTTYAFHNLSANTKYVFQVVPYCINNQAGTSGKKNNYHNSLLTS